MREMALPGDDEIDSLLALMQCAPAAASNKEKSRMGMKEENLSMTANGEKVNDNSKSSTKRSCVDDKSFADTRLTQNCLAWPCTIDGQRLLTLGCGLLHSCKGYDCLGGRKINNDDNDVYGSYACHSCDKLASTHELSISSSTAKVSLRPLSIVSIASVIVATRNLRCVIGEYHPGAGATDVQNNKEHDIQPPLNSIICSPNMILDSLDSYTGRILALIKKMQEHRESNKPRDFITNHDERLYSLAAISDVDLEILQEKTSDIIKAILDYKRAIAVSSAIDLVEKRLVAMASCDALYFRCYYAAITSRIATDEICDSIRARIPHPSTYFSCPGLTWDTQNTGSEALSAFLVELNDDRSRNTLLKSWELEQRLLSLVDTNRIVSTNPLLSLWQSRFLESIRHLWLTRYSRVKLPTTLSQTSKNSNRDPNANSMPANSTSQDMQLNIHETKALSSAVMRWRDSIRDYPANFYAYAVPTNEALHAISKCLIDSDVNQIVEAGAGTGYWSAIILQHFKALKKLRGDGLEKAAHDPSVLAYDIAPSSSGSTNEYHGEIPSFTYIHQADDFPDFLSSSTARGVKSAQAALLLCYPPPGSEMACKVLSAYLGSGGRVVIHVGEWQGLTGTVKFESRLSAMCFCQDVVHLPCWGSDATYLTIWRRIYDGDNFHYNCTSTSTTAHTSASGYCSSDQCSKLARRRCRFARCLQYCSSECYKSHSSHWKSTLALHMIDTMSEDLLKFDDDDHFLDLSSIISTQQVAHDDYNTRPRKRKKHKKRH